MRTNTIYYTFCVSLCRQTYYPLFYIIIFQTLYNIFFRVINQNNFPLVIETTTIYLPPPIKTLQSYLVKICRVIDNETKFKHIKHIFRGFSVLNILMFFFRTNLYNVICQFSYSAVIIFLKICTLLNGSLKYISYQGYIS